MTMSMCSEQSPPCWLHSPPLSPASIVRLWQGQLCFFRLFYDSIFSENVHAERWMLFSATGILDPWQVAISAPWKLSAVPQSASWIQIGHGNGAMQYHLKANVRLLMPAGHG